MHKAGQLSKALEQVGVAEGMKMIETSSQEALHFDVIGNAMCIMHDDGSVSIFESSDGGAITSEVISPVNVLRVLQHYRPFKEVFKGNIQ